MTSFVYAQESNSNTQNHLVFGVSSAGSPFRAYPVRRLRVIPPAQIDTISLGEGDAFSPRCRTRTFRARLFHRLKSGSELLNFAPLTTEAGSADMKHSFRWPSLAEPEVATRNEE